MFLERAHVLTLLATAGALGLAPGDTAAQSTPTDSLRHAGLDDQMAAADKHLVYAATARTVRVAPTLTLMRAGGTLTVRW